MSRVCSSCGRGPSFGNNRSHSMVATKRRFDANLQKLRILKGGVAVRAYVCTRCASGRVVGDHSRELPVSQAGSPAQARVGLLLELLAMRAS